jgi:uncharacterized membrane protein
MAARFFESPSRSVVKTLTFRALILISDGIITFSITHNYSIAIGFIVFTNLASILIYYLHERAWNHIHWGKKKK